MDRTLVATISGILEGLLICSGIFAKNAIVLSAAVAFFVIQWKHLGK